MGAHKGRSNGGSGSCVSALLFYFAITFILIVAINHLTGS